MTPLLESVKILRLKPGDIIVIETEKRITWEQAQTIRTHAESEFPGHKVLVLSEARVRVTREETAV